MFWRTQNMEQLYYKTKDAQASTPRVTFPSSREQCQCCNGQFLKECRVIHAFPQDAQGGVRRQSKRPGQRTGQRKNCTESLLGFPQNGFWGIGSLKELVVVDNL